MFPEPGGRARKAPKLFVPPSLPRYSDLQSVLKLYGGRVPSSKVGAPHRDFFVYPSRFGRWMIKRKRAS